MISRPQFRRIQIVRGLSNAEIVARTGIPPASLSALLADEGKEPSKMINSTTFDRLAATLGLESDLSGLRQSGITEWRFSWRNRKKWESAILQLLAELFHDAVDIAILSSPKGLLFRRKYMVFLQDEWNNVRIVVNCADEAAANFIALAFGGGKNPHRVGLSWHEFNEIATHVSNGVLKISVFALHLGKERFHYDWTDVRAAAQEFNFVPDNLMDMMLTAMKQRPREYLRPSIVSGLSSDHPSIDSVAA